MSLFTNCEGDRVDGGEGGANGLESEMVPPLDYVAIGERPVSALKDPLILNDLLPEQESNPEVKTNVSVTTSEPSPILIHHPPKKSKKISTAICTKCNTGFPSPFLFEQHMIQVHQDERPYPCKFCGKPFAQPQELQTHETIHDPNRFKGEPKFACDICGKRYHIKGSMEGHRKIVHFGYKKPQRKSSAPVKEHHSTSGVKNPNPYRKPKEIHPCPHCDLTFDMKCLLQKHMTCHTKQRPFSCPLCEQPFPKQNQVKKHIQTVHQSATPSGMRHPRPKWQANQPCPCTLCGKVYPTPSTLEKHMLLHTGEKPHVCPSCGKTFRLKDNLNRHIKRGHTQEQLKKNPLKLFKCRICGKDDFVLYPDLNSHRQTYHRHIPFEKEIEKTFGCGICGKPYYLREGALICALLGHDPTSLREAMFKHKCTECPSDHFGFHNLAYLRRHWEVEHPDKQLPVQFRVGMYSENLKGDELPSYFIDKVKKEDIQKNGPPADSQVKSEFPLYTEFDLLPIPEQERFYRKGEHQVVYGYQFKCTICGYHGKNSRSLAKHAENKHEKGGKRVRLKRKENPEHICAVCGLKMSTGFNLQRHVENVHDPKRKKRRSQRVGGPRKLGSGNSRVISVKTEEVEMGIADGIVKTEPMEINEDGDCGNSNWNDEGEVRIASDSSMFKCSFCERSFPKIQPLRMHELRKHVKPWSTSKNNKCLEENAVQESGGNQEMGSLGSCHRADNFGKANTVVNIYDKAGIKAVLNCQSVQVLLTRLVDEVEEGEVPVGTWRKLLGNKELKIVLDRVDRQELT